MTSHKTRPYPERIEEIDGQIEVLLAKRRKLAALWLASECKPHDGLRARGRVLRAQVDAGMGYEPVVAEILRMADKREIELPAGATSEAVVIRRQLADDE